MLESYHFLLKRNKNPLENDRGILDLPKEMSKRSLSYLVLPKSKKPVKDSHVQDHRSKLKRPFIDKRCTSFTSERIIVPKSLVCLPSQQN